jgi:hypothetical protein
VQKALDFLEMQNDYETASHAFFEDRIKKK